MYKLLILIFLHIANGQGQPPYAPNVGDTVDNQMRWNEMILTSVYPYYYCHLISTNEILGYAEGTNTPIYKMSCEGMCLANIYSPSECQKMTSYIKINTQPNSYNSASSNVISVVSGCQCNPMRCAVQKFGYTQYIDHNSIYYDQCNKQCTCYYGEIINCQRQRKSLSDLSFVERTRFINALITISTQDPYQIQYNAAVAMYQEQFLEIHGTSVFLPWHRYYLLLIENLLQTVDCRVTIPYWDWNSQAANPFENDPWLDSNDWFGGNGNSSMSNCVTTGPFSVGSWALPDGSCLIRNFDESATFATFMDVQKLFNTYSDLSFGLPPDVMASNYDGFRFGLEAGPGMHNTVHCSIGGTMCTTNAAASPEFLICHANIDRLWANWQSLSYYQLIIYSGDPNALMPGILIPANNVFDITNQPGGINVYYVNSPRWSWLTNIISNFSPEKFLSTPEIPVSYTNASCPFTELFNFTEIHNGELERNNMSNIVNVLDVLTSGTTAQLTGIEIDLTDRAGQYDVNGVMTQYYPMNINDICGSG